jgi:hypothetical protein
LKGNDDSSCWGLDRGRWAAAGGVHAVGPDGKVIQAKIAVVAKIGRVGALDVLQWQETPAAR